jgi:hypothetical protein
MPNLSKTIVLLAAMSVIATTAYAAINYNSARSNIAQKFPVGDKSKLVRHSFKFSWSIDPGKSKLTAEERLVLLEAVFKEIRKDVLESSSTD